MRTRRRPIGAAALALVTVLTTIAGSPAAGAAVPPTLAVETDLTAAQWDRQRVLETNAQTIEAVGRHDPNFTSVRIDVRTDTVTVYLTKAATDRARYLKAAPEVTLRFETALLSRTQIERMSALVSARRLALEARGMNIVHWGMVDGPAAPFVVEYTASTATAAAPELQIFGPGTLTLRPGVVTPLSRLADTSPYYGGSRILTASAEPRRPCTTGFAARSNANGRRYLTMAWHCVKLAERKAWTGANRYMGPVSHLNPLGMDSALIDVTATGASASARIFEGGVGSDTQYKPVTAVQPIAGAEVCLSGSFTRAICGARVGEQSFYIVENQHDGSKTEVHVYSVTRNGAHVAANGDSGGPVFSLANNNTTVVARGQISGGIEQILFCPSHLTGHRCYRRGLVVDITRITNAYNVSLTGF